MQDALPAAYSFPRQSAATVSRSNRAGFVRTLHSTFDVFARHPLPVFACAFFCFAGVSIIGSLLYGVMISSAVMQAGAHTDSTSRAYTLQLLLQAGFGSLLFVIGRGALTWIALQSDAPEPGGGSHTAETPVTFRQAMKVAMQQWRPLLLGALLYGVLITLGLLGLLTLLREVRLDASTVPSLRTTNVSAVLNWTTLRAVNLLLPNPGSPFTEWFAATRDNLAQAGGGNVFGFSASSDVASPYPESAIVGLAALALLALVDVFLSFRTAAAMALAASGDGQGGLRWLRWLRETVRVSSAHFGRVLAWRWLLQLMIVAFATVTLVLLPALHQSLVLGVARQAFGIGYWPYHMMQSVYGVGIAFVNGLLIAVAVIFEARMYTALSRQ